MLSRRSSIKNQTCPVVKKSDATPNQNLVAPAPAPYSQSTQPNMLTQRTNGVGPIEYGHDLHPWPGTQSTQFTQRTNSVGRQGHDLGDMRPLARTQSTIVAQRTNSVGHQKYGHDLQPLPYPQSSKVTQRTNSVGYGNNTESTIATQITNRVGPQEYSKVTQRTNSVGHREYGHDLQPPSRPEPTKLTQKTNSFGHHEQEHYDLKTEIPKKSAPIIEFPVSPELDPKVVGEGVTNANHPQHRMVHVDLPIPFTCMGCKEYGAGPRFTCQQCNFELHDFCALAPPVLKAHPLHSQHQLLFNPKPGKGGILRSKCDVCGKPARGYLFHCSACSYQLHPSCAMLSAKMKFPTHPHQLLILPSSTTSLLSGDPGELPCSECKRKRSGQVYRCTVCDYNLHAVCAKNMVNGLHANGIKGLDKPSVLGVAAKIASHVVVGFMGGLVEGLGEGLGEALTQNFVKGRCNSGKKSFYPGN